jgi:hypothetical protein
MSPVSNRLRAYLPLQAVQPSGSTAFRLEPLAVLPNKSTMQCPGFSSGVSHGKAGSLPKSNQYINTRFSLVNQ